MWSDGEEGPPEGAERWTSIYHCRDVEDVNVVVSFGFFEGTLDELGATQQEMGRQAQASNVEDHVDEVLLDGSYEVVEELTP